MLYIYQVIASRYRVQCTNYGAVRVVRIHIHALLFFAFHRRLCETIRDTEGDATPIICAKQGITEGLVLRFTRGCARDTSGEVQHPHNLR